MGSFVATEYNLVRTARVGCLGVGLREPWVVCPASAFCSCCVFSTETTRVQAPEPVEHSSGVLQARVSRPSFECCYISCVTSHLIGVHASNACQHCGGGRPPRHQHCELRRPSGAWDAIQDCATGPHLCIALDRPRSIALRLDWTSIIRGTT